jgi:hypothetical protein
MTSRTDHEVDIRDGRAPKFARIRAPRGPQGKEPAPTEVIVSEDLPPTHSPVFLTALDDGQDRYLGAAVRAGYTIPTAALGLGAVALAGLRAEFGLSPAKAAWLSLALGGSAFLVFTIGHVLHLILRERWARRPSRGPALRKGDPAVVPDGLELRIDTISNTIEEFQQQAARESSGSFRDSRTAMAVALIILTVGTASVVVAPDRSGQLVVGGLTALGSGFSAFLGKTFLDARNRALWQLNRAHAIYMAQLHSHFAFQMASKTDPAQRAGLIEEIVRSAVAGVEPILSGFLSARTNHASAQEHARDRGSEEGGG